MVRQREKILDSQANSLGEKSITEMINKDNDRNGRRDMTANSVDRAHDDDESAVIAGGSVPNKCSTGSTR
jgi:hypothetical protein